MRIGFDTPNTDEIVKRMQLRGAMSQDQSGRIVAPELCCS